MELLSKSHSKGKPVDDTREGFLKTRIGADGSH